jgi:hypothetical protein
VGTSYDGIRDTTFKWRDHNFVSDMAGMRNSHKSLVGLTQKKRPLGGI